MSEPVVLSGSSLNTFLRCPKQWEYAYIYRLKRPPSLKQALGTSAHSAAEVHMRAKLESHQDGPLDIVLDAFRTTWAVEGADAVEKGGKETRAAYIDSGVAAVAAWHQQVAPLYQPAMVEQHVQFALNGIPIDGTIDLVDDQGVIRDHKFVSKKPSSNEQYIINLTGYAIGYRRMTGKVEAAVQLDHIVRTQKPYYEPISSDGPIDDAGIVAYAGIVNDVMKTIDTGVFLPHGLKTFACSWCPYTDLCPAYRRR